MKQTILFFSVFTILFACNSNSTDNNNANTTIEVQDSFSLSAEAEVLYQLVSDKHDTAMLLMSDIARVQDLMRKIIEESNLKSVEERCLEKMTLLRNADKAMMVWMNEFKGLEMYEEDYKNMSEEEIMNYLQSEEDKIESVHEQMLQSIKEGEELASELSPR